MRVVPLCLSALLAPGALALLVSPLSAQPAWWAARGVTTSQAADDYAVANLGQLKVFATAATVEMNAKWALSGGAGSTLNNLVLSWWQPPSAGIVRDDYAGLNQGQLKAVAAVFYDRLGLAYPWTTATATDDDDYALANLGQLKNVFGFTVTADVDTDLDGLLDSWETARFGGLTKSGTGDEDGDGLSNRVENLAGANPNQAAASVAASTLGLSVYSP